MKSYNNKNSYKILFIIMIFISLFFIEVGYSFLQTNLKISGELLFEPDIVATTNGKYYASVSDAITETEDSTLTDIVMLKDSEEQITIPINKKINLNTNGNTLSSTKTTIINYGTLYISGNVSTNGDISNTEDNNAINNNGALYISDSNIIAANNTSSYNSNAIYSTGSSLYIQNSIVTGSSNGIISNLEEEVVSIGSSADLNDSTVITGGLYSIKKEKGNFVFNSGSIKGTISPGYLANPTISEGYRMLETTEDGYYISKIIKNEEYTITYSSGSLGTGSDSSVTKIYGNNITLLGKTFTREGYIQTGWATEDGGEKVYELNDTYTDNSSATLYPYWTICNYTIGQDGVYQTVAEALESSSTMCTFQLVNSNEIVENISIPDNYKITLDLNGQTTKNSFTVLGNLIVDDTSTDKLGSINNKLSTSDTGNITINNGNITVQEDVAIAHNSTGTVTINGGTITGATSGIEVSSGTLTIGTDDDTLSITNPSITGTSQYGINVLSEDATISFYDGIINGFKGEYAAVNGTIDNILQNHKIITTITDNVESIVLEAIPMLYLYNNGDTCSSLTGGWLMGTLNTKNNTGSPSLASTYINLSNSSTSGFSYARRANIVTSNKIDTTGYNYLNVEWSASPANTNNKLYLGLYTTKSTYETSYTYAGSASATTANTKQIKKISIASYQGSYYIGGFLWKAANTSSTYTGKIYRIWLSYE